MHQWNWMNRSARIRRGLQADAGDDIKIFELMQKRSHFALKKYGEISQGACLWEKVRKYYARVVKKWTSDIYADIFYTINLINMLPSGAWCTSGVTGKKYICLRKPWWISYLRRECSLTISMLLTVPPLPARRQHDRLKLLFFFLSKSTPSPDSVSFVIEEFVLPSFHSCFFFSINVGLFATCLTYFFRWSEWEEYAKKPLSFIRATERGKSVFWMIEEPVNLC